MDIQECGADFTKIKEEIEMQNQVNPDISISIKTEVEFEATSHEPYNPFTNDELHIKNESEPEKVIEAVNTHRTSNILDDEISRTVENILIEVKTEIECNRANTLRIQSSIKEREESTVLSDHGIKEETDCDESGYDCSTFDNSMDSEDLEALRNVEACLSDDEMNAKNDLVYQNRIKFGPYSSTTENSYTTNDSILSRLNAKDNSKHMQITPEPDDSCYNDEAILPTPSESMDTDNGFQLNSITGNVLSLEHLIATKSTNVDATEYMCTKCPKVYNSKRSLNRHLKVHEGIEKRTNGIRNGLRTKLENKLKLKQSEEETANRVNNITEKVKKIRRRVNRKKVEKDEVNNVTEKVKKIRKRVKEKKEDECEVNNITEKVKRIRQRVIKEKKGDTDEDNKEYYKCSCGSKFKRRTLMEACLKSHEDYIERTQYHCLSCNKVFCDRVLLEDHRKKMHRKRFPCKFCPTDYGNHKELLNHLQLHHKVQAVEYKIMCKVIKKGLELKCVLCLSNFLDMSALKSHVVCHEEPFKCPLCKSKCPNIIEYSDHNKTFHPKEHNDLILQMIVALMELKKSWICDLCDVRFLEADKLGWHKVNEHSPELKSDFQVQCEDCRRVFLNQKALTSHRRVHHSSNSVKEEVVQEETYVCLECRKVCQDQNALDNHMRFHDPERKFPCKFCDFRFATIEKRKKHAEVHTGAMKYVCFICEYQCSSEHRLNEHKKSIKHLNVKQYLVTGIPMIEGPEKKDKVKKKKKKERDRGETEVPCDICGDKFDSMEIMLEHQQAHPFIEFPNDDKPTRIFFK